MGEHLVVCVDRLTKPESSQGSEISRSSSDPSDSVIDINEEDENLPLLQNMECRICQEEDSIKNLETPCACNGSLKFAHRKCVQRWCNEKGDTTCEICHHIYQPGYTAPPPRPESATIDINGSWTINGAPVDIHDPRLLAMATAEHQLLEADYDEYNDSDATGAAFCRSAALILMALLLLRHAISIGNENGDDDEDDATTFFSLFLLRAAGFLLPCYIMAWAISIMQRRRQRQEEAAEVAFMLRLAQQAALQSAVSSGATTEVDNVTTQGEGQEGQVNVTHPLPVQ